MTAGDKIKLRTQPFFWDALKLEDKGTTIFRNVRNCKPSDTASHPVKTWHMNHPTVETSNLEESGTALPYMQSTEKVKACWINTKQTTKEDIKGYEVRRDKDIRQSSVLFR